MKKLLFTFAIVTVLASAFSAFAGERRSKIPDSANSNSNMGGEIDHGQNQGSGDSRYLDVNGQSGSAAYYDSDLDDCPAYMEYEGTGLPLF